MIVDFPDRDLLVEQIKVSEQGRRKKKFEDLKREVIIEFAKRTPSLTV